MSTSESERVSSLASWSEATLTNRDVIAGHVASEYGNDVDAIVATVSDWDVQYTQLTRSNGKLVLRTAEDKAGVHRYYENLRARGDLVTTYQFNIITTPWYSFRQSVGVLKPHEGSGPGPDGNVLILAAALLPARPDGLVGEIGWQPYDFEAAMAPGGVVIPTEPLRPVVFVGGYEERTARVHERFVSSWRDGDGAQMEALIANDCCSLIRTAEVNGDYRTRVSARSKAEHRDLFSSNPVFRPREIKLVNLVVGRWFAFGEYIIEMKDRGREVRRDLAVVYPIGDDGELIGLLAYGLDQLPRTGSN